MVTGGLLYGQETNTSAPTEQAHASEEGAGGNLADSTQMLWQSGQAAENTAAPLAPPTAPADEQDATPQLDASGNGVGWVDQYWLPAVTAGQPFELAIPMSIYAAGERYDTNVDREEYRGVTYNPYTEPAFYAQDVKAHIRWMEVALDSPVNQEGSLLVADGEYTLVAPLISEEENLGYAAFQGLKTREGIAPGAYRIDLTARWQSTDGTEASSLRMWAELTVLSDGAKTLETVFPEDEQAFRPGSILLAEAGDDSPQSSLVDEASTDAGAKASEETTQLAMAESILALNTANPSAEKDPLDASDGGFEDEYTDEDEISSEDEISDDTLSDAGAEDARQAEDASVDRDKQGDIENTGTIDMQQATLLIGTVTEGEGVAFSVSARVPTVEGVWESERQASDEAQEALVLSEIFYMAVELDAEQLEDETFPLAMADGAAQTPRALLFNGRNMGQATLSGMVRREGAADGTYPVRLNLLWQQEDDLSMQTLPVTAMLHLGQGEGDAQEEAQESEESGEVRVVLSDVVLSEVTPGERISLPITASIEGRGASLQAHGDGLTSVEGQDFALDAILQAGTAEALPEGLTDLSIALDDGQFEQEGFPFSLADGVQADPIAVVRDGTLVEDLTIDGLLVQTDATEGTYSVKLSVAWSADGETFATDASVSVHVEDVADDCLCCEHCEACYDPETGMRNDDPCACIGEEGVFLGCGCPCPFLVYPGDPRYPEQDEETEPNAVIDILSAGKSNDDGVLIDCGCECHYIEMDETLQLVPLAGPGSGPYGSGQVVYTQAELLAAVTAPDGENITGGRRVIYLGYTPGENGQANTTSTTDKFVMSGTGGVAIPSYVTELVLCGTDPSNGTRLTFTDWLSDGVDDTIRPTAAGQTIILADMDILGKNLNGTVYGSGFDGTRIEYNNIGYQGRQMCHNERAGTTSGNVSVFRGCTVLIDNSSARGTAQEWTETNQVIVEPYSNGGIAKAATTVTHLLGTSPVLGALASFKGLTIVDGASLTINSTQRLFETNQSAKLIVEGTFTLDVSGTASAGVLATNNDYFGELYVAEDGAFHLNPANATHSAHIAVYATTIAIDGTMTMNYNGAGSAIAMQAGTGGLAIGEQGSLTMLRQTGTGVTIQAPTISVDGKLEVEQLTGGGAMVYGTSTAASPPGFRSGPKAEVILKKSLTTATNIKTGESILAPYIELDGDVNINHYYGGHTINATTALTILGKLYLFRINDFANSTFASINAPKITIGDPNDSSVNADVSILHQVGGRGIIVGTAASNTFDLYGDETKFYLASTGFASGIEARNVNINENVRFLAIHYAYSASTPVLSGLVNFYAGPGTDVVIHRNNSFFASAAMIYQASGTKTLNVISPKRFDLSNLGSSPLISGGSPGVDITLTAPVMNHTIGSAIHIWNNLDMSEFTAKGKVTASAASAVSVTDLKDGAGTANLRGIAPDAGDINTTTFNFAAATSNRLIVGEFPEIVITQPVRGDGDERVRGITAAQDVRGYEYELPMDNTVGAKLQESGDYPAGGEYFITLPQPISASRTRIFVRAQEPATQSMGGTFYAYGFKDTQGMVWLEVNEDLLFEETGISFTNVQVDRQKADWTVTVHDTRGYYNGALWNKEDWTLQVEVLGKLKDFTNTHTLEDSRIALRDNSTTTPLDPNVAVTVMDATGMADGTYQLDIDWDSDLEQGFCFNQASGEGENDVTYETKMRWTIVI